MTTSIIAKKGNTRAWQTACDAGSWLALAASPTFALMAWIAANAAPHAMICSSTPGELPIGGMAWMYLLMSLFHASPWLKLASGRPRQLNHPTTQAEGD
jgi:hypothetical protein